MLLWFSLGLNNEHFVGMRCTNKFSKFGFVFCFVFVLLIFSCFVAEEKIQNILKVDINKVSIDQIEGAITANNLCDCRNPITTAFEVSAF